MLDASELRAIANLPLQLFDDVAIGTDTLDDIFVRHGYSTSLAAQYRTDPRFNKLVADRKDELEKAGLLHASRAGSVADMALSVLAARLSDSATPTSTVLEIYKASAKMGNLEPKGGASVEVAGTGFSIKFNLGGPLAPEKDTIDAEIVEQPPSALASLPLFLKPLNSDLEYTE